MCDCTGDEVSAASQRSTELISHWPKSASPARVFHPRRSSMVPAARVAGPMAWTDDICERDVWRLHDDLRVWRPTAAEKL